MATKNTPFNSQDLKDINTMFQHVFPLGVVKQLKKGSQEFFVLWEPLPEMVQMFHVHVERASSEEIEEFKNTTKVKKDETDEVFGFSFQADVDMDEISDLMYAIIDMMKEIEAMAILN